MSNRDNADKFGDLVRGYLNGKVSRRQFIVRGAQLGLSAAVLAKLAGPARAAMMDSAPEAPYESPVTAERAAFLKTKPYKGTTINVMVLKATVGDGLKYHVAHWAEETGGKVNVAEVPIETLHTQIFSDLSSGLGKYDAYMTGCWYYGDFFVPKKPYIVALDKFIADPKHPYWDPDQLLPSMKKLYTWEGHLRALEDYVKFLANGPREEISWTLGQGWNLFLAGHSAMEPTWGDLPTLAQDPKVSKVQGKMGAAGLPGTTESFNPITGEWKKYDLNQVGNTNGGSWHCVISAHSKNQK